MTTATPVSLAQAETSAPAAATVTYKPVGAGKREGNATYQVVESSAAGKPMYLQVSRTRKGKPDSVKRIALAPIAAAVRLGVIV